MLKLVIGNSTCQLNGFTAPQFKQLRGILSYTPDPASMIFGGGHRSGPRFLIDKRGTFPTGLLYLVKNFLSGIEHTTIDNRRIPMPQDRLFTLSLPYPPYPEQIEAAEACRRYGRGIIVAPTGVGKSAIAALIINALQVRTLIVVPSLELKHQLIKTLGEAFGRGKVGGMGFDIAVENIASRALAKTADYGCVIVDEFHHSGAKTYRELNKKAWGGVYYKFGLTATPFRSQDHERLLLESVLSNVIYRISYQKAVSKGYIVPVEPYYIEVPKQKVEGYTWHQVYSELVVNNEIRNGYIASVLTKSSIQMLNTLCLVKEIAHGNNLTCDGAFMFANGKDGESNFLIEKFNSGLLKVLIGTNGVVGEGVDTKPAEYIIIAGLGKSKNAFMQQVGRGLRKSPGKESCKVIIFKDGSHKWTKAHFAAQVKILKEEYGVIPAKLEL